MTELPATLTDYMAETKTTSETPDKEAHSILAERDRFSFLEPELSFPERFVTRWRKSRLVEIPQWSDFQTNFGNVAERMGLKPEEVKDYLREQCMAWPCL